MPIAPKRTILPLACLGLAYFLLASATIATTRLGGGVAILFVANAALTAYLLTTARQQWRRAMIVCGVASTLATGLFGFGIVAAPIFAVINMAEAFLAASLFRRFAGHRSPLESLSGFFVLLVTAGIFAPALSALGGATVAALHGADFATNALRWFAGHALGTMTFAPACLLVMRGDVGRWARGSSRRQLIEAAVLLPLVAATTLYVFLQATMPLLFLPWLPVTIATFRLGRLGAAASIGIVTVIAGAATLANVGPIVEIVGAREAELQFLQFYLASTMLAVLPAAAELARRKEMFERLQASERRYRLLADYSTDIILDIDPDGRIAFASAAVEQMGGYRAADIVGKLASELVDPADIEVVRAAHVRALTRPGTVETVEYRAILGDGSQAWMETRTQGVFDEDGRALGAVSAIRNVAERREREQVLAAEARTDGLTGALNRRAFMRELEKSAGSQRATERGCIALFDLDHFKRINDTLGHAAGDEVLITFVRLAKRIVREDDVVGRLGGEEFGILLKGATYQQARRVCDRLRMACEEEIPLEGITGCVTVSAGIAALNGAPAAIALEQADAALYRAKRSGRNRLELAA